MLSCDPPREEGVPGEPPMKQGGGSSAAIRSISSWRAANVIGHGHSNDRSRGCD